MTSLSVTSKVCATITIAQEVIWKYTANFSLVTLSAKCLYFSVFQRSTYNPLQSGHSVTSLYSDFLHPITPLRPQVKHLYFMGRIASPSLTGLGGGR